MQAAINYSYANTIPSVQLNVRANIIRKEATTKILLFAGILASLVLAVNI